MNNSLLRTTGSEEQTITTLEIAEMMGYQDPFHFSRRFKAVIGFSPQQYRREFVKV